MQRLSCLLLVCIAACATIEPTKFPRSAEGWNPSKIGDVYEYVSGTGTTFTKTVIAVDGLAVTDQRSDRQLPQTMVADFFETHDSKGDPWFVEGDIIGFFPLEIGKVLRWRSFQHQRLAAEGTTRVIGRERLTVPAGTFDTLIVVTLWDDPRYRWTGEATRWLAPSIGRYVKWESFTNTDTGPRRSSATLVRIQPAAR